MFGFRPYNYPAFTRDIVTEYMAASRQGLAPHPGDRAPDFAGRTLAGDSVRLSDYRAGKNDAKNVVLTFGSATSPTTAASAPGLNRLYKEYCGDDVTFLFVYVREAHPGEQLPAHESLHAKVAAAELLREAEGLEIPIVVDDLRGSIHRKYSKLPCPTFIIDKSGRIAFRCLWTQPALVAQALAELLERQHEHGGEHAALRNREHTTFPVRQSLLHTHRALQRGGGKSIADFEQAMGMPGRLALWSSRVAEPVAMNPGRAVAGALIAGGVIVGALFAGRALRRQRLRPRAPYDFYEPAPRSESSDYEAVGI